jgi:ribonuclease HI
MDRVIIGADGASRGNPGPAAIGAVIKDDRGNLVARLSRRIGRATNNQAEYRALIAALEQAISLGAKKIDIRLDSELIVRQLSGRYRVKNAGLKPLYEQVQQLLAKLDEVSVRHVPRARNAEADRLANQALDGK